MIIMSNKNESLIQKYFTNSHFLLPIIPFSNSLTPIKYHIYKSVDLLNNPKSNLVINQMSKPQPIQILQEHQDLVQKVTPGINTILGKSHYSFHINSAQRTTSNAGTEYYFKIKSNDGELYHVVIFQPNGDKPAQVLSGTSLYNSVDILPEHQERILGYTKFINEAYKADNSSYQIISVQQFVDDPSNFVFKVKGVEDGKQYKVKIERPIVGSSSKSSEPLQKTQIESS